MKALILCYAPQDAVAAKALGEYLGSNLPYQVSYEEGMVGEGFDLVDATERGLSAEAALVLLSPHSVPKTWVREKWQPVFSQLPAELGSLLGFVLLESCKFPELIRRQRFFEAESDLSAAARRIRRWMLRPDQPIEASLPARTSAACDRIVDGPGSHQDIDYEEALALAAQCEADFESVIRLNCADRSQAGVLGDLGHAVGISLPGTVDENYARLTEWAASHRCLVLVENAGESQRQILNFTGLFSTVFVSGAPARNRATLPQVGAAFFAVPRDADACAALLADAVARLHNLLISDFEAGQRLGWAMVSYLKECRRFAEAVELLDNMESHARERNDALALYRITWEQSWLREVSPENEVLQILPTAGDQVAQLSLF